ncbi:MAG: DUF3592 domain-containing protein [Bacteroidaceae bacterium]|nr:DUF3592 domain-containing protein [Bacteroidaceae bacterium]
MIWIAVGIGVLLVLIGCPLLLKTWLRRKNWVPVQAMCTECERVCGKKEKKYRPVFAYEYAGRSYTEEAAAMTHELKINEEYACCCDPENPECIILGKQKHEPLLMAITCALALAAGVILVMIQEGIIKL